MRPDILLPDIIAELRGLQDDVSPFPFEEAEEAICPELGQLLEGSSRTSTFVLTAAASIGQVHRASCRTAVTSSSRSSARRAASDRGRPQSDVSGRAARQERVRALDFIDAEALVDEFARSIRQELDYRLEKPATPRRSARTSPPSACPRPARTGPTHRPRVLTLEFPDGTCARRRRASRLDDRAAPPARRGAGRSLDDDDLPARVLPRGPASANVLVFAPDRIGPADFGQAAA